MKLFDPIYRRVMAWAGHRHAPGYLAAVSAMESSFFPVPVVFMLIPMVAARPDRAWWYALLTTVSSVAGGLIGYAVGYYIMEWVHPWIIELGYQHSFELARAWFDQWGFWALFLAGFSPIPYKIFTIAAGGLSMHLAPFIIASLIGRSGQFFLAAALVKYLGPKFEPMVQRYIEWVGWGTVILAVVAYWIVSR